VGVNQRAARVTGALAMAMGVALASAGGAALLLSSGPSNGEGSTASLLDATSEAEGASAPFPGLTEAEVTVGSRSLTIVVADDATERTRGLRERADLGDYDGMLFVFEGRTETAFTMSTVPVALDIGFYDRAGRPVDRLRMEPCAGSEAECPIYRPSGPFRFALETLAGDLPRGRLAG